ncbi:glycosyltransferase family 4 protein [Xanthomarina gelatinilytica]|uniref:glycosyltransferase family 4 protein n=1 Tax=Xanthomarina gelatinilytica TaxID=1137281 RepID=UPI003AA8BEEE
MVQARNEEGQTQCNFDLSSIHFLLVTSMVIGFEAQRIFRENKHGMDFVALELIKALRRLDTENKYVVFTNKGPDTACLPESDNLKIVTFGGTFIVWEQLLLPKYVKKFACDILHCTSNTAPLYLNVPTVVTIHDIIYLENNPLFAEGYTAYQRFGNYYRRLVVRVNMRRAKKIVTVSNFERKRLIDFLKLPSEKVDVVYNGVASHFFERTTEEEAQKVLKRHKLPNKYFLFLGNTDPKKNTRNTILAFAGFVQQSGQDVYLVVADLDGELVRDILRSEGLSEYFSQIHFTGYIDNKDLPVIIQKSNLFLYPSKRESFGIPILEAMAGGVPVITSNRASMPEVSGDAAFLIDPFNVNSMTEGMLTLFGNEKLKEKLATQGMERASTFNWDNSAKQMLGIYKKVFR